MPYGRHFGPEGCGPTSGVFTRLIWRLFGKEYLYTKEEIPITIEDLVLAAQAKKWVKQTPALNDRPRILGGVIGIGGGGAIGAGIGSAIEPGIGAVIGGVIGGMVGNAIGQALGGQKWWNKS